MATKIDDHKYSIEEAFRECFYVVPDYQREYVWTEKEVDRLLEDIDEQLDTLDRREYFIGTILVSPGELRGHFEVIDGPQRPTTLFLLLCALRKRFKGEPLAQQFGGLLSTSYTDPKGNLVASLKLEPRYENAGDLLRLVVAAAADPETTRGRVAAAGIPNFGSLDNLLDAYAAICVSFGVQFWL